MSTNQLLGPSLLHCLSPKWNKKPRGLALCFTLQWAVFELWTNFRKSAPQMTLTCSRSKIPTWMLHTPPRPKFLSVSLYAEPFLSCSPLFGKVHWLTPNNLDMFKVKNTNIHVTYNPLGPKFSSISLYDEPFLSYGPIFGKVHQTTTKSPWTLKGQRYPVYVA